MIYEFLLIGCVLIYNVTSKLEVIPNETETRISLDQCVLQICKTFFKEQEIISLLVPIREINEEYPNILQAHLFQFLMDEIRWPILVKNASGRLTKSELSLTKYSKNYVITIRCVEELSKVINYVRSLVSWNPHAKFLIVSSSTFENNQEVAKNVFEILWTVYAINSVVLLKNSYSIADYYIYLYYPYKNGNCGSKFESVTLATSCSFGKMQKNYGIYGNRIPKKLHKCVVKTKYVNWPPYVVNIKNNSNSSKNDYFNNNGIEISVMNTIAEALDIKFRYIESDQARDWGDAYLNGTTTSNLLKLRKSEVDFVFGSYALTLPRFLLFDCSESYIQDSLAWCVPRIQNSVKWQSLMKIFTTEVWICALAVYTILTFLIFYNSTKNNELTCYKNYGNSLLYTFGILIGTTVNQLPKSSIVRYFMLLLLIIGFNLEAAYESNLTSLLSDTKVNLKYSTEQDIYDHNLQTYFMPNVKRYYEYEQGNQAQNKYLNMVYDKWKEIPDIDDVLNIVAHKKNSAALVPKEFQKYAVNYYVNSKNEPLLHCFQENIVSYPVVLLMRKGHPLHTFINELIRSITESGLLVKWEKDVLRSRFKQAREVKIIEEDDINEVHFGILNFDSLRSTFLVLLVGNSIAFVIFVLEIVVSRISKL